MITHFRGEYDFLSNFYTARIKWHGIEFPTLEHAFQAAKATNDADREYIRRCKKPGDARRAGHTIELRSDWEDIKVSIMKALLRQKFADPKLRAKLVATVPEELQEGNYWNDTVWGVVNGKGDNLLGKLLMKLRAGIMNGDGHEV
jgi:ribA/ribD-fused uncharacterized protein